jgi:hypothetical protein
MAGSVFVAEEFSSRGASSPEVQNLCAAPKTKDNIFSV